MKYRIVNLRERFPEFVIHDFADARNAVLDETASDEYVLWKSEDEEIPVMLLDTIKKLPGIYPYYWIRRINLWNGRFIPSWNPEYSAHLVSRKVSYQGKLHEKIVPKNPHGTIDIPIIHNHIGTTSYNSGWKQTQAYRVVLAAKKGFQTMRYGW